MDTLYKVADGEEQTYVAMEESRNDNVVTGTYSYVDPLGSLITAGPMGYSERGAGGIRQDQDEETHRSRSWQRI